MLARAHIRPMTIATVRRRPGDWQTVSTHHDLRGRLEAVARENEAIADRLDHLGEEPSISD